MSTKQKNPNVAFVQDGGTIAPHEQQILDISSIGVLITRINDGTILYANKAIAVLMGFTDAASVIGMPVPDFYWEPEERKSILMRFRAEGCITSNEIRTRRADGSMRWASISINPFNYEGEQVLLSEIVDISERKRADEALKMSEERFHSLYDNATIGLYRTTPDGRILMINPTGLRLLGFDSFEELSKRNLEEAGFEEEDARKNFREKLEREGIVEQESVWTKKDGTPIFVRESSTLSRDENGNVLYYDGSFEDITAHKQAEEALRTSEERFKRFTEATVEGLVFHEQGRIIDVNPAAVTLFGLANLEELIGRNLLEFIVPEYHATVLKQMQLESVAPYEIRGIRKDGSTIPVETSTRAYKDGERIIRASSIRDITERKQAEEALRESQQLLQLVMDNIPQAVFWKDKELNYLGANQAFAEDAGLASAQDLVGKSDFDMPWKEQAEHFRADDQRVLESGETKLNYEEPQTNATGKVTWLRTSKIPMRDVNGNIFGVLGAYEDITERKQADEAMRESRQLIQLVMDNIPQAVFWKDKELVYLGTNQSFAEDAGFASPQEIVGRNDFEMPWKEQAELYRADDQRVMEGGEPKLNYEEPQTGPTGQVTWLRTSKIPMRDAKGNIFAVLGMYEDITEWKRLQQEVQTAFERRGYQVQVSTEISQEVSAASELSGLFERVVTLTKERLGYYHTQLLRYDAAQDAVVLISGYGETGQKMLAGGHQMPLGEGLIGTAAASGETVLRPSLADDPDWHPNPLLPETKGEIAVPIKWQDNVLGVLDVQSNQAGALTEEDRLLLEGLCGQVAVAMEQTRLRQEMAERLEEVNRLYQSMSHEGWKDYRNTADLPTGFMYDQAGLRPVDKDFSADDSFVNVPMKVLGGEVVGTLAIAEDPRNPTSDEDRAFLQQVSEQIALALESARLSAQTQSALSQSENLFAASRQLTQATDLQGLVKAVVETLNIPVINRAGLEIFSYTAAGELDRMTMAANWWNGTGREPETIGRSYAANVVKAISLFLSPTPLFFNDTFHDERVDPVSMQVAKDQNYCAIATLPLFVGKQQIGILTLTAEETHDFTQNEIRLFSALAPQIATVLENRRQFERAQQQAERESTLNIISQKIQGATTVEAVLQIAARELGHALGAPMTIAQLSMKDKK